MLMIQRPLCKGGGAGGARPPPPATWRAADPSCPKVREDGHGAVKAGARPVTTGEEQDAPQPLVKASLGLSRSRPAARP
jgi:hypothetical protein